MALLRGDFRAPAGVLRTPPALPSIAGGVGSGDAWECIPIIAEQGPLKWPLLVQCTFSRH